MSTQFPSKNDMPRNWYVLDAQDVVLGRLATKVAMMLMGKHKPIYTPFLDTGDHVVIVNAEKVRLTGHKEDDKMYRHHTGYPGGLKERTAKKMRQTRPHGLGRCRRRGNVRGLAGVVARRAGAQVTLVDQFEPGDRARPPAARRG